MKGFNVDRPRYMNVSMSAALTTSKNNLGVSSSDRAESPTTDPSPTVY